MKKTITILALGLLIPIYAWGQAVISLGKPITTPNITQYEPGRLTVQLIPQPMIEVVIVSVTGREERFTYPCQPTSPPLPPNPCTTDTLSEVATLIEQLNTVNLTTRSLWRRIFDRLVVDFPSRFPDGATVQ